MMIRDAAQKAWQVLTPLQQQIVAYMLNLDSPNGKQRKSSDHAAACLNIPGVGRNTIEREYEIAMTTMRQAISRSE
jgi:hypothetical protein